MKLISLPKESSNAESMLDLWGLWFTLKVETDASTKEFWTRSLWANFAVIVLFGEDNSYSSWVAMKLEVCIVLLLCWVVAYRAHICRVSCLLMTFPFWYNLPRVFCHTYTATYSELSARCFRLMVFVTKLPWEPRWHTRTAGDWRGRATV